MKLNELLLYFLMKKYFFLENSTQIKFFNLSYIFNEYKDCKKEIFSRIELKVIRCKIFKSVLCVLLMIKPKMSIIQNKSLLLINFYLLLALDFRVFFKVTVYIQIIRLLYT